METISKVGAYIKVIPCWKRVPLRSNAGAGKTFKNRKPLLNVTMLHSLNCMWHVFIFRDSSNPNPYTVRSFLVNQGLASHCLSPFQTPFFSHSFDWKVWHAVTYCSAISHSWCHTYKVHYFVDFFFPPLIFLVLISTVSEVQQFNTLTENL